MRKRAFLISIALILLLTACGGGMPKVKHNADPLWEIALEGADPKFVEDYIYLWDLLENEYPMLAAAQRITGKDAQEVKERYYKRIPQVSTAEDFLDYLIFPCLYEFRGTGHVGAIDKNFYAYLYQLYTQNPNILQYHAPSRYTFEVLQLPAAMEFYSSAIALVDAAGDEVSDESFFNRKDNLRIDYFPKASAGYLRIGMMNTYPDADNPEYNQMMTLFETLEREGYAHCIIDIRGNGGGNSRYWSDGIVAPNLSGAVSYDNYLLIKGEASKRYLNFGERIRPISKLPRDEFSALHPEDLEEAQYFVKLEDRLTPETGKKPAFSGRFWLLVDERSYSSSEKLAIFCKQTGFATLVGTTTGGDGIGTNPIIFVLPNTGICVQFSAANGLNPDGSCNEEVGTAPDYYINGKEDALEKCLALITNQP